MTSLDIVSAANPTAAALVRALLRADVEAIAACFTADAKLRSLNPPGLRERDGATEIAELMSSWFADCEQLELVASSSSTVVDREHLSYRFAGVKEGRGRCVIEQQIYAAMDDDRYADMTLLCSGFRPT